jgi:hypothetical protein
MPISTVLGIAAICALASAVNGFLGAGFCLFLWMVLLGIINDSVKEPVHITQYTWAPHLLLPVAFFLIFWQWRLRGRIGPQFGFRDLFRLIRRPGSSYA